MKKTITLVLVLALGLATEVAKADFVFGEPAKVPNINSPSADFGPCVTADGLELYFGSSRNPGGDGCGNQIWVTTRSTIDELWGAPQRLGPPFNTSSYSDTNPSISADGLEFYFSDPWPPLLGGGCEFRPGGHGRGDVWVVKRDTRESAWNPPINLGSGINSFEYDGTPHISADGLSLYFCTARSSGHGFDLYISRRTTKDDPWDPAEDLGAPINTMASQDYLSYPFLTPDGLSMFFTAAPLASVSRGNVFMSTRASATDSWQWPVRLAAVNSDRNEQGVCFCISDSTLYFGRSDTYNPNSNPQAGGDTFDIWQASINPILDLNADGIVDADDMCIVVDNWRTDNQLCDIGPMPWGDGVVDVEDLIVISEHLFEVYPSAETVDVNEADDGGQIELELGKLLVVTLESNPSTGYRWELVDDNESILKQFGEVEFKSSETSEPPIVGAGGWEIFRFKAVSAGQMTLELIYHRSWEDVEPLKTFSIQVVVR